MQGGGVINQFANMTTAPSSALVWATACCYALNGGVFGQAGAGGLTFSLGAAGSATGPRYLAVRGGVIDSLGGGANVFPGSVAGTAPTGYYN